MSDTPRTDAAISDAWMMCGVHVVSADFARQLERELALSEAKLTYLRSQRAGEMGEKLYQMQKDLDEAQDTAIRWFMAASPYATPGSLEEGLRAMREMLIRCRNESDDFELHCEIDDVLGR